MRIPPKMLENSAILDTRVQNIIRAHRRSEIALQLHASLFGPRTFREKAMMAPECITPCGYPL